MKNTILVLLIALSNLGFSQSNVIEIDYNVDVIDAPTGLKNNNLAGKIDWQLTVWYDATNVQIWRKFADDFHEVRIINKQDEEVLLLKTEWENEYAFFATPSEILNMDMSSNYGDTTITITDEHRDILGYDCYKIKMDFGGQANATLWVTDALNPGVILPGTPMTLEKLALEYRFEESDQISVFKAKHVKRVVETINNTSIPDDYSLIVPASEFDVTGIFEDDPSEFEFIQYPRYPQGKMKLHDDLRSLCSLTKTNENNPFDIKMAFIEFTVKKDGTLTDIRAQGFNDQKETEKIVAFLSTTTFTPAIIKGEAVNSSVTLSVSLNK